MIYYKYCEKTFLELSFYLILKRQRKREGHDMNEGAHSNNSDIYIHYLYTLKEEEFKRSKTGCGERGKYSRSLMLCTFLFMLMTKAKFKLSKFCFIYFHVER